MPERADAVHTKSLTYAPALRQVHCCGMQACVLRASAGLHCAIKIWRSDFNLFATVLSYRAL